jgi:hypothetical protein
MQPIELLRQAGDLVRQHEARQAATGEAFNIFSITKIERAEVNTHSAMIAELLNPRGSHGQGATFLALFLSVLGFEHECSLAQATVRKEQSFTSGRGRVDIVIHLKDHLILIENKVDAQDGKWQLKQYADIGMASGKTWHLWYLSKLGGDAKERSHRGVWYRRMSYREHVLKWLALCVANSGATPALQQAIIQYKNLVHKITGTSMTHTSRAAMVDLLTTCDHFKAADEIVKALPYAKGAELYRFFETVERELLGTCARASAPIGFSGHDYNVENCAQWFMARRTKSDENVGLFFNIGIEGTLFRVQVATHALHYGIVSLKDGKAGSIDNIKESLPALPPNLLPREWNAFHWQSCMHQDRVATNMDCLLMPDQVIEDIKQTIAQIKSRHGRSR